MSVIPIELVRKHGLPVHPTAKRVEMANGADANCQGVVELLVKVGPKMCRLNFLVVGGVKIGILGLDVMGKLGVVLNTTEKLVTLTGTHLKDLGEEKAEIQESLSKCITYGLYKVVTFGHSKRDLFGGNLKIKMPILQTMHISKLLNIFKRELDF